MCEIVVRIFPAAHWSLRALLTVLVAYVFHRLFERPFMSRFSSASVKTDQIFVPDRVSYSRAKV
jgi:peptidoglycan/LPS O-acetylase OafA/YrhL